MLTSLVRTVVLDVSSLVGDCLAISAKLNFGAPPKRGLSVEPNENVELVFAVDAAAAPNENVGFVSVAVVAAFVAAGVEN
jgi:hypothetical protein